MIIWVRSQNCGCLVTRFCYQLIAKPGNKTAAVSWPGPYSDLDHQRSTHSSSAISVQNWELKTYIILSRDLNLSNITLNCKKQIELWYTELLFDQQLKIFIRFWQIKLGEWLCYLIMLICIWISKAFILDWLSLSSNCHKQPDMHVIFPYFLHAFRRL